MKAVLYGVGVGPGHPELLTLRAVRILSQVDVVAAPVSRRSGHSLALTAAAPHISPDTTVVHPLFPMSGGSDAYETAAADCARMLVPHLEAGRSVAFLTLGDISLYSTFYHVADRMKGRWPVEPVAGIPAFCAASARTGRPLSMGDEPFTIIPGTAPPQSIAASLSACPSAVIYKPTACRTVIYDLLEQAGMNDCVLVSHCETGCQLILPLTRQNAADNNAYMSLILARRRTAP